MWTMMRTMREMIILFRRVVIVSLIYFQSSVNPSQLDAAPFQIRPAIFELKHKETTLIEVIFRPTTLGPAKLDVLTLCDNCHMKQFTFKGMRFSVAGLWYGLNGRNNTRSRSDLFVFAQV